MGVKQLRLSDPQAIQKRIREFIGKPVTLVLKNSMAMMGTLVELDDQSVTLQNMRLKKVRYPFESIEEVYLDSNA